MKSSPLSRNSSPKSALRLTRVSNILTESNREPPNLSLDLIRSSSKNNDTPYPSPASLRSSSSPVSLRQILLFSPSPLRKSRNHFDDNLEKEAMAIRRGKTRGGQSGLSACSSPRNRRRSRRRSEVTATETKEDKEVIVLNDENQNPNLRRRKKTTSRSNKEKQSSVPLLPSPCLVSNPNEGDLEKIREKISDLEKIRENISDLVMWKDTAKSTLWFGLGSICYLSSCFTKGVNFSVFSVISHLGLLFLAASFLSNTVSQRVSKEARRELYLSEETVLRVARRVLPITNLAISKMSELFSGEPAMTLKVTPFVLIGSEYGYLITLWRLCAIGFFLSFTVPKLYSCYAHQIHQKVESTQKRVIEAWRNCSHKKIVIGSAVTAFWNLTSVKIRFFTVFMILVIIRYRRQNLPLDSEVEEEIIEEKRQEPPQLQSPEKKSPPLRLTEDQALVVVAAVEGPKNNN